MNIDPLYREIILEHWRNPSNHGVIAKPTFDVVVINHLCGDEIRLTGTIQQGKLTNVKFISQGCAIATASASLVSEKIKKKKITEIKRMDNKNVIKLLNISLTPMRQKCALLILHAIKKGI
jgi:nitrogen fixation protein NifU and related proteins